LGYALPQLGIGCFVRDFPFNLWNPWDLSCPPCEPRCRARVATHHGESEISGASVCSCS